MRMLLAAARAAALVLLVPMAPLAFAVRADAQTPSAPAPAPKEAAKDAPDVDVRLFATGEIDRSKGCSLVFWQANRDPDKDRFAHALFEQIGQNDSRRPARMKIGERIVELTRIAVGGKKVGYGIHPFMLYRSDAANSGIRVIVEITAEDGPGEVVEIEEGKLTIIEAGRAPFVMRVKGNAGCNTTAAPAAPPPRAAAPSPARPPLEPPSTFERYAVQPGNVPAKLRNEAVRSIGCDEKLLRQGVVGYSLSEESALWEMACQSYAGGAISKFYALVYTPDPAKQYTILKPDIPKGRNRQGDQRALLAPQWDIKNRIVTSTYTEGNGSDCGVFERHQLTSEGNLVLIEYREKTICDGKSLPAKDFPLIFRR